MRGESWPPWRDADDETLPQIGQPPVTRKQFLIKLAWVSIWMVYLGAPVSDLLAGNHAAVGTVLGWAGLVGFVATYLALVFRTKDYDHPRWLHGVLGTMAAMAVLLSYTLGEAWLVLFVYTAVACGAVLPTRYAKWAIPAAAVALTAIGLHLDEDRDLLPGLLIPTLLGGFAMVGVRQIVHTVRQLREARAAVAQLAASEERLRLARDLHDLLGHSLSLITLKSELAGRMLPARPKDAAAQVADIEKVSRQALVDVREAVSGYRRPQFAVELAGARVALAASGVEAAAGAVELPDALSGEGEAALAWALKEAVTNVVRHADAAHCEIAVSVTVDGEVCLSVVDDGVGPGGAPGNGLAGLSERMVLAEGRLETGPGARGGFALRAYVPLEPAHPRRADTLPS
ncbi:sensor histidine kinase [Streptomyces boninensis]|uniref:sensor histidine kinase n=1 Tax=Streptomyces boninensis TaxID=2039455 RepID=UPI003B210264